MIGELPGVSLKKNYNELKCTSLIFNKRTAGISLNASDATEYFPSKTGEYPCDIPQFSKMRVLQKNLKNNKHNSIHWRLPLKISCIYLLLLLLHLAQKYHVLIFDLGHYLFLKAHSFPRASFLENSSLLGTDNREFKKTMTARAMGTSLNRRFN